MKSLRSFSSSVWQNRRIKPEVKDLMMIDLIRTYQLNIMLFLCASCITIAVLLFFTEFLPKRRKWILILMEFSSTFLLYFDRMAYVYKGVPGHKAYVMVRLSNFCVFFLTPQILVIFNMYIATLVRSLGKAEKLPKRLIFTQTASLFGMLLAVVAHFTGLYYYFDEMNVYHRGPGFLLCYVIPILVPVVQFTVVWEYRKYLGRLIFASLVLYLFVPLVVGVIQIFIYGVSMVNMAMVLVSICMYFFTYLDINETVRKAHDLEMKALQDEKKSMRRIFEQTATAFVTAVEKRDPFLNGHSKRVADYARRIAQAAQKSEDECDDVYYTALLNDVGLSGIPDELMSKREDLTEEEAEILREKPEISAQILSGISDYPVLRKGALHSSENYDGSGYPDGLAGERIPESSRITAVADGIDMMTSKNRFRDPLPYVAVREELLKQAGAKYDPRFASLMVQILDQDKDLQEKRGSYQVEKEISCGKYRDSITVGIPILPKVTRITFKCIKADVKEGGFSYPSVIVFDSFDRHVYHDTRRIGVYNYLEYGELWFDGNHVSTAARSMEVSVTENTGHDPHFLRLFKGDDKSSEYEIITSRFEDHVRIVMKSLTYTVDVIMALTDKSKDAFIGLTGENCQIRDITVEETGESVGEGDIRKITDSEDFTERMESDIPNIQVNQNRSAATEGLKLENTMRIDFHTQSLPAANLIWHCPYVVIFYSDDRLPRGEGYREYALIKLNGEATGDEEVAVNHLHMKKKPSFNGWDDWKEKNREGMECSVELVKKGNMITFRTENLGVEMENTTVISDIHRDVYVSLTGDLVALTDIRVR